MTHDGRRWLKDALVGLANQDYPMLDILVVDDASSDSRAQPPLKRVAKRHLRRRRWGYVRTPRALGFGGAINWSLARVRTDADLLLFIHDDAVLEPGSIRAMVDRTLTDDGIAIVGPKIVGWDDPGRLEEVGMAADRFGYPYKGLEAGEIDLGQHDSSSEVFYVTSTCMLIRHGVFRQLRGWDARMRAFSEDLDLCWRARLAGHSVRYEPAAKARHAMALATGLRSSPFVPTRYFIRRNRLRAVAKNASALRLLFLIPQFILLAFAEMLAFTVVRQPGEILNLARALAWNIVRSPQTLVERRRIQRRRKVPDYRLRRLTVRQSTRLRSYFGFQAHRVESAWGRRAELLAARGAQARALVGRLAGAPGLVAAALLIGILVGFRGLLWSPPATVGELLPYPGGATDMWRAFASPWQNAGLGYPGPAPPAFAILGLPSIITLGSAGAAQKVLLLGLGVVGFFGAYSVVTELVDRWGRIASGLAYAFGAVGYAGIREGSLAALVFGAAAPWVIASILRLAGWMRPPGWRPSRAIARIGLGAAISAAFVPGSLIVYLLVAIVVTLARLFLKRSGDALPGFGVAVLGLVVGWALLLPWSGRWFDAGMPLSRLTGDGAWEVFAAAFQGHGVTSTLLGQTPQGPPMVGLALALLGVIAVLTGAGARRRVALTMWAVIALTAWLIDLTSTGAIRPLFASPTEAGVPAAVAFAALAGLSVGAFRLDLRRRLLGWIHALTLGLLAFAAFLVAAGIGPTLWHGDWAPGRGVSGQGTDARVMQQVGALLDAEAQRSGRFRSLWVGRKWSSHDPSAIRPRDRFVLTGGRSQVLTDLFQPAASEGDRTLRAVIASIEEGTTDRGGQLLGAFNIHMVVVDRQNEVVMRWLRQRELALIRTEDEYVVLRNEVDLPHAAIFDELPVYVRALATDDEFLTADNEETRVSRPARRSGIRGYVIPEAEGPGTAFLAETAHEGWVAEIDDTDLERVDGGWGNAFELPAGVSGRLEIDHPRSTGRMILFFLSILAWVVVVGAAGSRRKRPA